MTGARGLSPRRSVAQECGRRGRPAVVGGCVDLLAGRDVDDELILALGGPPARYVLDGHVGGRHGYWPRVWAARGLLHAWDDAATATLAQAGTDEAWRVREMVAKVVARHGVGGLRRVRASAERALHRLAERGL